MMKLTKNLLAVVLLSAATVSANAALTYGESGISQPYVGIKGGQIIGDNAKRPQLAYGAYIGYNFDKHFGAEIEYQTTKKELDEVSGIKPVPRWMDLNRGILNPSDDLTGILIDNNLIEAADIKTSTYRAKQHAQTYGAYGTYRHNIGDSNFYVKGKLGAARVTYYTYKDQNVVLTVPNTDVRLKRDEDGNSEVDDKGNNKLTAKQRDVQVPATLVFNDRTHHTGLAGGASIGYQPIPLLGVELGYNYLTHEATGYNLSVQLSF